MEENQSQPTEVIAQMAEHRAAIATRVLTFADAVRTCLWLRATPDAGITLETAKEAMEVLFATIESSRCFYNAAMRGQRVFTLVQQDRAAPEVIKLWSLLAERHGCSIEKVHSARELAQRWAAQDPNTTKWPD